MRSRNACNADDVACIACTRDAMRCMINFNIFVKNPLDCDVGLLTSAQSCSELSRKCVFFHMRKLLKSSVERRLLCLVALHYLSKKQKKSRKSFSPRLDGFFLCCVCKVAKNKNWWLFFPFFYSFLLCSTHRITKHKHKMRFQSFRNMLRFSNSRRVWELLCLRFYRSFKSRAQYISNHQHQMLIEMPSRCLRTDKWKLSTKYKLDDVRRRGKFFIILFILHRRFRPRCLSREGSFLQISWFFHSGLI